MFGESGEKFIPQEEKTKETEKIIPSEPKLRYIEKISAILRSPEKDFMDEEEIGRRELYKKIKPYALP